MKDDAEDHVSYEAYETTRHCCLIGGGTITTFWLYMFQMRKFQPTHLETMCNIGKLYGYKVYMLWKNFLYDDKGWPAELNVLLTTPREVEL